MRKKHKKKKEKKKKNKDDNDEKIVQYYREKYAGRKPQLSLAETRVKFSVV